MKILERFESYQKGKGVSNYRDAVESVLRFEEACRDFKLGPIEGLAIVTLLLEGGSAERSSFLAGFNPSMVSRTINRLEESGHCFRECSDEDRRKLRILLADAGWELAESLLERFSGGSSLEGRVREVARSYLLLFDISKRTNLTITQLLCIALLDGGASSAEDISRSSCISRTTAHMALSRLADRGLVKSDGARPSRFALESDCLSKLK